MIKYVLGTDLILHPELYNSMFKDRASQFSERLGWNVQVDKNGFERDPYDRLNPIYVVIEDAVGRHAGSMRLLPTTGRTMINDHFLQALDGKPINDAAVWECTRFCISPCADRRTAAKLFAAAGRLMEELSITSLVAVFSANMLRKYRTSCVPPKLLGEVETIDGKILAGRWDFTNSQLRTLFQRASLDPIDCELALANSFIFQFPMLASG